MRSMMTFLAMAALRLGAQTFDPGGTFDPAQFTFPPFNAIPTNANFNAASSQASTGLYVLPIVLPNPITVANDQITIRLRYFPDLMQQTAGVGGYGTFHPNHGLTTILAAFYAPGPQVPLYFSFGIIEQNVAVNSLLAEFWIPSAPPSGWPIICPQYRWIPVVNPCPFGQGDPFADVVSAVIITLPGVQGLVGVTLRVQMLWWIGDGLSGTLLFPTRPTDVLVS